MQGLWLSKGSWAFKSDLLDPVVGLGESLVAVQATGICGTDLALAKGYYDFNGIPGHEFIGRVVSGALTGQRVVADINLGCGQCLRCQAGVHRHCAERVVIGIHQRAGAFAQFLSVPDKNLIPVDEGLRDELAVLAEPVAAALEIIEQMPKPLPSRVLVVGAGRLGLLVAEVLASFDCEVTILVRSLERAAHLQNKTIQVVTSIDSESFGWLVDCSGTSSGLTTALQAAMPQAILVLKSTLTDAAGVDLSPVMVKELTVLGSRCGPMDKALAWLGAGHLQAPKLAYYRFSEIESALAAAKEPSIFKVLLEPDKPSPLS
ncbi:MAG: alcohol dehydrogenase catalytic domain-containing protein [Gammaproteobacteria bacterium]|jgi:threonine dehydrogenase-like Zn-dependent dehydrogenase|nr:alcohol dehydrogenase catalytic domain-containing protein [Gammaproteobacteria bacterium]MBT5053873.1 alcohol dehydrogenase catalytic domain-containing protein [Gammaproteobacteria bacterium]